jgi:hypothetical protein
MNFRRKILNIFIDAKNKLETLKYQPSLLLNKSALALDISNRYDEIATPIGTGVASAVFFATLVKSTALLLNKIDPSGNLGRMTYLGPFSRLSFTDSLKASMPLGIGPLAKIPYYYERAQEKKEAFVTLHEAFVDLKNFYTISTAANALIANDTLLQSLIPSWNILTKLSTTGATSPLFKLKQILNSATFKQKNNPDATLLMGDSLLALAQLEPVYKQFIEALYALGHLDAYLSIATLYKEFESQRVHYSLPEYKEQKTPLIEAKGLWNPFIDPAMATSNDLTFGAPGTPRNMILSGSNTGGKSTLMKGATYNIYLSQTICIVPSSHLAITPFGYIGSSLNIADSQSSDISTFKAEAIRAKELYKIALMGSPNFFVFLTIDELFKGTNPKSGSKACYIYAKQLSVLPYLIFFFATHFTTRITKLETETNGVTANFKLEITPEERYKLQRGINTMDTAPAILKKEFEDLNPHFFDEMQD